MPFVTEKLDEHLLRNEMGTVLGKIHKNMETGYYVVNITSPGFWTSVGLMQVAGILQNMNKEVDEARSSADDDIPF